MEEGRIISDDELKQDISKTKPYRKWLDETQIVLEDLDALDMHPRKSRVALLDRQQAFGYSQEDLKLLLTPMATTGQEAIGSMGTDTPISAMSDKSKPLFTYFKQKTAYEM